MLHSHWENLVKEEIQIAKALSGNYPLGVTSQRHEGDECLDDSTLKFSGSGSEKKPLLAETDILAATDIIVETSPPQGFIENSSNSSKLKLPSFLPPTVPPSID